MAQSSHGIPYPVGTDRVMDGDDNMKAMAQFIDDAIFNVPRGKVYLSLGTSGTLTQGAWTSFGAGLAYAYTKGGVVAVSPSQLRVPKDGLYHVEAQVFFNTTAASGQGWRRGVRAHLNGSNPMGIQSMIGVKAYDHQLPAHASGEVELHANDTVALAFWHDQTGANLTAIGDANAEYTFLSLYFISAL